MTSEQAAHLEMWKQGALALATEELELAGEQYRARPITEFNMLTAVIGNKARRSFFHEFSLASVADFNGICDDLKRCYAMCIGSALNQALPLDYPFIVALVYSDQTPQMRMCSMQRKAIPGSHDLLSRNAVPLVRIKDAHLGESGGIRLLCEDVEYLSP